jgi:hypothetical protein
VSLLVATDKVAAKWFAALKNADNLVKDILHAADINQDGTISFEGISASQSADRDVS